MSLSWRPLVGCMVFRFEGEAKIIPASDGISMYTDSGSPDTTLLYLPDSDHVCMDALATDR